MMVYALSYIAIGIALVVFLLPHAVEDREDVELGAMFLFLLWPVAVPLVAIAALGGWACRRRG